ncbi:endonuclease [Weeksellaceae bacterium KMM 9724]|uniref:endonuclease n=1 Tax=Profundicola chukchiensis TaxID=2961959 RepID=UPI002437D6ED|nr:endonuclease [Profundicola chukchiensis]MDG4951072.1 endonuclease [Profundicola chukchiensis]
MRFLNIFILLLGISSSAQIPSYYNSIDFTASPEEVKSQLEYLVRNTQLYHLSYTPQVWYALKETDADPENPDNVFLIYGYDDEDDLNFNDRTRGKDMTCHVISCTDRWNREHVYPKSIGGYTNDSWPGSDVHSIRAADSNFNEMRSNFPFAEGSGNASVLANSRFYPGDEWKGDVARMMMFSFIRYPNDLKPNYVGVGLNSYHEDMPDIFLQWNAEDPPSAYEMQRNDIIEEFYQGNRNPFIDNPYLATYIWGGPEALNTWDVLSTVDLEEKSFSVYPNPTHDYITYQEEFDQILIYNLQGQLISEDENLTDNKTYLPETPGLYFVKFCQNNTCKTLKVLKK